MLYKKRIGIVGGVGPYAGLDLHKKIYNRCEASLDQEYVDVVHIAFPSKIADRTGYLVGDIKDNPGTAISDVAISLKEQGCDIIGIPCNTAHVSKIFNVVRDALAESNIELLHMIKEVAKEIVTNYSNVRKVGVLSTSGTLASGIYPEIFLEYGLDVVVPIPEIQEQLVHSAIYDKEYGIKSVSFPVHEKARKDLLRAASMLRDEGAELVILACTEIPLAIPEQVVDDILMIDPTDILAKALVAKATC